MSRVDPRDTDLLLGMVRSIQDAGTLDDALHILVTHLQKRFELWHASLCSLPAESAHVRILASWSMTDSAFVPGTEVATSVEPMEGFVAELARDEVVVVVLGNGESLTDYLMREQGVRSVAGVPVYRDDAGMLFLALGSSGVGPFQEVGDHFFHGLAAGIRTHVCKLAESSQ